MSKSSKVCLLLIVFVAGFFVGGKTYYGLGVAAEQSVPTYDLPAPIPTPPCYKAVTFSDATVDAAGRLLYLTNTESNYPFAPVLEENSLPVNSLEEGVSYDLLLSADSPYGADLIRAVLLPSPANQPGCAKG